ASGARCSGPEPVRCEAWQRLPVAIRWGCAAPMRLLKNVQLKSYIWVLGATMGVCDYAECLGKLSDCRRERLGRWRRTRARLPRPPYRSSTSVHALTTRSTTFASSSLERRVTARLWCPTQATAQRTGCA